jgi:hypothetical protein
MMNGEKSRGGSIFQPGGNEALVQKDDGVGVTTCPSAALRASAGGVYERYEMSSGGPGIEDDFGDGDAEGWSPAAATGRERAGSTVGSRTAATRSACGTWR